MKSAQQSAEEIVGTYDTFSQFAAIVANGCGEWELDRAAELADSSDPERPISTGEIVREVERLCRVYVAAS